MKAKSTNILYTYVALRSFVKSDITILKKHFNVVAYHFKTENKKLTPISFIRQGIHLLFNGWNYDYLVCFFAGYHSILPAIFARITGKKCYLILGGTECFNYPSFRYGNFTKRWYGKATCISANNASLLVPVSSNLIQSESPYYTTDSTQQGIYHWCQPLNVPFKVIGLEYNGDMFTNINTSRSPLSFLTVAFGIEGTSFIRKGIDKFIMMAQQMPEATFTIIGCRKEEFPVDIPVNVTVIPPVPYQELPNYYNQHQFYVQLSIAEGFPSAIVEAMLCECIAIGSHVAAIPDIVGECGFLVKHRNDQEILETVQKAISFPDKTEMAQRGRAHIIRNYGPGKRETALIDLFLNDK